jgi:hypothetical protein
MGEGAAHQRGQDFHVAHLVDGRRREVAGDDGEVRGRIWLASSGYSREGWLGVAGRVGRASPRESISR